jgi:hypothetical protein
MFPSKLSGNSSSGLKAKAKEIIEQSVQYEREVA